MKTYSYPITALLLIILVCSCQKVNKVPVSSEVMNVDPDTLSLCDPRAKAFEIQNSITLPRVTQIPHHKDTTSLIAYLQDAADVFSWENFIAMNWPAMDGGIADSSQCIGESDAVTVWEYWVPDAEIYRKGGQRPAPWASVTDSIIQPRHGDKFHHLRFNAKDPDYEILNAEDAPVVDQDSNFTMYQISYNKMAYDYVVSSGLYSLKGQQEFVKNWPDETSGLIVIQNGDTINIQKKYERAYFPVGNVTDSIISGGPRTTYHFTINPVSIIVKSGWKQLTDADDRSAYHVRYTKNIDGDTVLLGLVGMHFIQKVAESTQWVWSTFEHVHNAPMADKDGQAHIEKGVDYIYFNESDTNKATYNMPNMYNHQSHKFQRNPTQIVREVPVEMSSDKINDRYHDKLRAVNPKSVWLNYRLIGTQWPFDPELFTFGGDYQPEVLANTVMETYKQETSSCMGCHKNARFKPYRDSTITYNGDFIFSLSRAK